MARRLSTRPAQPRTLARTIGAVGLWTPARVLGDDIGARNNLQRWLGILEPFDYDGVQRVLARWRPFHGLVYLHLLLWGLQPSTETDDKGAPTREQVLR